MEYKYVNYKYVDIFIFLSIVTRIDLLLNYLINNANLD